MMMTDQELMDHVNEDEWYIKAEGKKWCVPIFDHNAARMFHYCVVAETADGAREFAFEYQIRIGGQNEEDFEIMDDVEAWEA